MTVIGSGIAGSALAFGVAAAASESARLDALTAAAILDTPADPRFDGVAKLAAMLCGTPIALISFLAGDDRQWFKASVGLTGDLAKLSERPRSTAFCEEVLRNDAPMIVEDVREDARFADFELVTGFPFVRFYAGYPVRSKDGYILGALCVLDDKPRVLDEAQKSGMSALAHQIEALLDLNSRVIRAEATEQRLSHLELLTHAALDVFLFLDENGAILEANSRAEELYGYTAAELSKLHIRDLRVPEADATLKTLLREIVLTGGARFETEHRHKDGRVLPVQVAAAALPQLDPRARKIAGRTPSIFAVVRDIGDRVAVARVGGTVRAIMQNLQDGVVVTNPQSIIVDWNAGAERILGYRAEEVLGKDSAMLFAAPDSPEHKALLAALFKGHSYTGAIRARDRNGAEVPIEASITVVVGHKGEPALCVSILRDVRSRVERENALERAKDAAETANLLKTRFLGNMTHELRTPLNAILGFARVLQKERYGPLNENQRTYVQDVLDSGEHMLRLVTDLLDLQRAEEGRTSLELRPVPIRQISDDALRMVRELATERHHELTLVVTPTHAQGEEPQMVADARRLVQVLVNLLANAIAYTPSGGRIRLAVDIGPRDVIFAVEDNGVGISETDQERLFHEFERLGDPTVARGFGIGLALSKRLVEEHGGTIRAESRTGVGSRFVALVPRRLELAGQMNRPKAP